MYLQDLHVGIGHGVCLVSLEGLPDDSRYLGGGAVGGIHDQVEIIPVI